MSDEEDLQSRGEYAVEALERMLELSGFADCKVQCTQDDDERIKLVVATEDEDEAALLIGRQGNTMASYQFLVGRMVQREFEGRVRLSLDIAGYGESRRTQLEELGSRLAKVAVGKKLELRVLGMNPADRRSVHMSLADQRGIKTWSESEGIGRRLVIRGGA